MERKRVTLVYTVVLSFSFFFTLTYPPASPGAHEIVWPSAIADALT
jgi:hypothetical protein